MARANTYHGAPCKDCGKTLRYERSNRCVTCQREYSRLEYATFAKQHTAKTQEWHQRNRAIHNEMMRAGQLRRKFGMTVEQYDDLERAQRGACAICRIPCITNRRLAVDHCHSTGKIRGLLCHNCNIGLGKFQDDPAILERAAAYLLGNGGSNTILSSINSAKESKASPTTSALTEVSAIDGDVLESLHHISSATTP